MLNLIKSKVNQFKLNRRKKAIQKIQNQNLIFFLAEHMREIGLPGRCRNHYRQPVVYKEVVNLPVATAKKEKVKKIS